jgi:hypothetical protein
LIYGFFKGFTQCLFMGFKVSDIRHRLGKGRVLIKTKLGSPVLIFQKLKLNQVNDSKALAKGKVEVQPETLTCSSSSLGLDSWPPNNPQIQTFCSGAVFEGSTQVNPASSL